MQSHRQRLKAAWGPSHLNDNHHLRVHVDNLRQRLKQSPVHPRHLLTEAAVGYRLIP